MAFGNQYGDVIDHIECPRCGSELAVVRSRQRSLREFYELHITCEKCHLVKFKGMTSSTLLATRKMKRTLVNLRNKAAPEISRLVLDRKIAKLEEKERMNEIGL